MVDQPTVRPALPSPEPRDLNVTDLSFSYVKTGCLFCFTSVKKKKKKFLDEKRLDGKVKQHLINQPVKKIFIR